MFKSEVEVAPSPSIIPTTNKIATQAPFGERYPLAAGFAASSISVASAVFMTNWIDVIKIRQQVAGPEGKNLFSTGVSVVRNEGVLALYRGVTPAVVRGMMYGGKIQPIHHAITPKSYPITFKSTNILFAGIFCRSTHRPLLSL